MPTTRGAMVSPDVDPATSAFGPCGVMGGGTMGAGIAVALLRAGLPVVLVERSVEVAEEGPRKILDQIHKFAAEDSKYWQPPPLLSDIASRSGQFSTVNKP